MVVAKSKALLIGINYKDYTLAPRHLFGCINDVGSMAILLEQSYGLHHDDITILTDEIDKHEVTWAGIVLAIHDLCAASWQDGGLDTAYFFFSGHGIQTRPLPGTDTTEADGLDEGIAPYDFDCCGPIKDHQLRRLFQGFNPSTKVVCVFDSSHSGSIVDLPYHYVNGEDVTPQFIKNLSISVSHPRLYVLSGCKDKQVCQDDKDAVSGAVGGVFTQSLVGALSKRTTLPLIDLQKKINAEMLNKGHSQQCVVSCSHALDAHATF
jgi:hypothetical protein